MARPRFTLALLTLLSALAFMDRQILAVLIQPVKAEFGLSDLQIGLVTGLGFALTLCMLGVPLGRLADRGERRALIAWSRGAGGLVAALGAAAGGFWSLMASRAGSALSDAGGVPASMSMLADLNPPGRRSRAMSVFGTGSSLGALLALVLGSWIAQRHGWRAAVAAAGSVSLVLALLLRLGVREPAREAPPAAMPMPAVVRHDAIAAIWREPVTRWLIVGAAFALLAGYSFGSWNTALLVRRHGLSMTGAGWISGAAALTSVLGSIFSGAFTDRLVRRDLRWQLGVPVLGLALALPSGLAYLMLPAGALHEATALVIVYAFFMPWWAAPTYAALSLVVPGSRRATASAMVMLSGAIVGNGVGPIFTGWLSDVLDAGTHGDGLRCALAVMVGMLLPALLAFLRAMRAYPKAYRALH